MDAVQRVPREASTAVPITTKGVCVPPLAQVLDINPVGTVFAPLRASTEHSCDWRWGLALEAPEANRKAMGVSRGGVRTMTM